MNTKLKYTVSDIKKFFTKIQENTVWFKEHKFQADVVKLAAFKFEKRAIGWFMHNNVWDEVKPEAETLGEAWKTFEDKHFTCYRRWRKNVGNVGENFLIKEDDSDDLGKKADRLFLFYLVYGECHDFRNLKHVLNLLFHVCLHKWENGEKDIADWIRTECHKLYRFLSLIYSNSEMTQQCFLHDDLDDLCHSTNFVKAFWEKKQFLEAFGLADPKNSKYPYLTKVITTLETPNFILYWQKGFQQDLLSQESKNFMLKEPPANGEKTQEPSSLLSDREKWILTNFFDDKKKEDLEKKVKDIEDSFNKSISFLQKKQKDSEEEVTKSQSRNRPTEKAFENDANTQRQFSVAFRQYQSAIELLSSAAIIEQDGMKLANDGITKGFKDRKQADKLYSDSIKKLELCLNDYDIAKKSFESAQRIFSAIEEECVNYLLESTFLKDKAEWRRELARSRLEKIKIQKELMYKYEDTINDERFKFAKQWKTFFEKAGGPLGLWGYFTIIKHYSIIVYLHLFLLIPMAWLYFEYYDIFINGTDEQISKLYSVDFNDLVDLRSNIILCSGAPIVVAIIFFIIFNFLFAFRTHGKNYIRRDKGTGTLFNLKGRFAIYSILFFTIITELAFFKFLVLNPLSTDTNEFTKKVCFCLFCSSSSFFKNKIK